MAATEFNLRRNTTILSWSKAQRHSYLHLGLEDLRENVCCVGHSPRHGDEGVHSSDPNLIVTKPKDSFRTNMLHLRRTGSCYEAKADVNGPRLGKR